MQRRRFFQTLFGGMGAAILGRHSQARESSTLLQESPVAGFQYYRGNAIWPFLREGEKLSLVRESFNGHDRDAVAVYFRNDKLGFVPHRENSTIAQMLDRGDHLNARIIRLLDDNNPWRKVRIGIFL
ncbi:MAG: HIRAN domain-containing protein, partial [Pseudomonadota bacterium]